MRSRFRALLALLASGVAVPNCESQDDRIFDVCVTLERCTGYVDDAECGTAIRDAIDDRRLATSAVARCAQCLGDHAPGDGSRPRQCPLVDVTSDLPRSVGHDAACRDMLKDRVCDSACGDVSFVLRARTSTDMRQELCAAAAFCGEADAAARCRIGDRQQFACSPFETQLDTDANVDACRSCIVTPRSSAIASSEGKGPACQLMVDACREPCRKVPVSRILSQAELVLDVCESDSCFMSGADGGAGGAASAEGVESGGAAGAQERQPCFERLTAWLGSEQPQATLASAGRGGEVPPSPVRQLALCTTCVAGKDCPSAVELCSEQCAELPLGEAR